MPEPTKSGELEELITAPLEELVAALARSVAQAQDEMDLETLERLKKIYDDDEGAFAQLRQMGYQPTWYRIPEATAEVSLTVSIGEKTDKDVGVGIKLHGATMNATYSNSYNFNSEAASKLTFRIVPVPPAPRLEAIKVVPKGLAGRNYGEVRRLLSGLDIDHEPADPKWEPQEDDQVTGTEPGPGEILLSDRRLKLMLTRPQSPHDEDKQPDQPKQPDESEQPDQPAQPE